MILSQACGKTFHLGTPAFTVGNFPAGSTVIINNNGYIAGGGGFGGAGGNNAEAGYIKWKTYSYEWFCRWKRWRWNG